MIRVLLVDDHAMVRSGLEQFLRAVPDIEVVATAANGQEAVDLSTEHDPDVILMDLLMPVMDGIEATRIIKARAGNVAVIALTTSDERRHVQAALDAGVDGYLIKDIEPEVLIASIRSVIDGGVPVSPSVNAVLLGRKVRAGPTASPGAAFPGLTPREIEVLRHIRDGWTNKQIAAGLGISEKTVKTHCSHLFQRIDVGDRKQAAEWARQHLGD